MPTVAAPDILDSLRARFGEAVLETHEQHGDRTALIKRDALRSVMDWLREESPPRFDFLADVAGVDGLHLEGWPDRFQVVYQLRSMGTGERLRIKASVPEDDPWVETVSDVWASANWAEREVWDMFGVRFRGHPNLKRILCIHTFKGHALRKDYDIRDYQWLDEENESLMDELGDHGEIPEDEGFSELVPVNLGPAHPATHGTLRTLVKLDGEVIVKAVQEIGYLHRGFEKHSENSNWTQVVPYTDRLNYCSAMMNNVGYCMAAEKLLGIEVPERTHYIRVIIAEMNRIMDHLVCLGACLVDVGALTNFWYLFNLRERAYNVLEGLCGARLTNTYVRIGGVADDLDPAFIAGTREFLRDLPGAINDVLGLIKKNRIFLDRVQGVGVLSKERSLSYGFTGPCLRASGVDYDLRKAEPYLVYGDLDFDVPVYGEGDSWARMMVRFDEMIQSMRIMEQCLEKLPGGPVFSDDKRVMMPVKEEVYGNIEALMNHFVLVYDGIKIPPGETYGRTEAANGELGFYLVSDGSGQPYRVRCRPPCFYLFNAYAELITGCMVPDAIAVLSTLNIIAGELDR